MMRTFKLSVYTEAGLVEFSRRWNLAKDTGSRLVVDDMIEDPRWTQALTEERVVEFHEFPSRRECGAYFSGLLDDHAAVLRTAGIDPVASVHLWVWFSSVWCEWLQQVNGEPKSLGESARWIYQPTNHKRYYRHLLAGPYLVYSAHRTDPGRAQLLLYNDVMSPNTAWVEQICGRRDLLHNGTLLGALTEAIIDPRTKKPRSGTSALTRKNKYFSSRGLSATGTISRLGVVHNQLLEPWYLLAATRERLAELFGSEFLKFFPR